MNWSLFRWTWLLKAPLYVGTVPAGSLNRCCLYVPARAVWGAVSAELARGQGDRIPDYQAVGNMLLKSARFTYFYPAESDGCSFLAWLPRFDPGVGLVWRREDGSGNRLTDRQMRKRLLGTRPSTAVDPSSDAAAEGSLRETECVNTHWQDESGDPGSPMAFVGYIFVGVPIAGLDTLDTLIVGGDTRYGLGWLHRAAWTQESTVFGLDTRLDVQEPIVKANSVLGHAGLGKAETADFCGQLEVLGGWDHGKAVHYHDPLWTPGSRFRGDVQRWWQIEADHFCTWTMVAEQSSGM